MYSEKFLKNSSNIEEHLGTQSTRALKGHLRHSGTQDSQGTEHLGIRALQGLRQYKST